MFALSHKQLGQNLAAQHLLSTTSGQSALCFRAMEESGELSLEESLQLMSLYLELLNAAEADYVIGESRGLSADVSVSTAFSTTVWMSNRHGRAFWANVRYVYTPEFSALIDEGMAGGADGVALNVLKSIGEGVAGNLPTE